MTSIYRSLAQIEGTNQPAAFCVVVRTAGSTPRHSASKMIVYPDGRIEGTVGGGEMENRVIAEAQQAMRDGQPRFVAYNMADPARGDPGVCGGQVEVFVEPIMPKPTLVVIGAGHVGKAVAHLAHWLGFHVAVQDDRPGFATPDAVPAGDAFYTVQLSALPAALEITPWTYLVLTTRGSNIDVEGLPALLDTPAAYIGVIGSRRRWAVASQQMIQNGVPADKLARVRTPIGLEIHAESPEEIAVSILAEIIALRNQNAG